MGVTTFLPALESLIVSRLYKGKTLKEKINAVKKLESDYYDAAINMLLIERNSENELKYPELVQVYNDLQFVKTKLQKEQY